MYSYYAGGISSDVSLKRLEESLQELDLKDVYKTYHRGQIYFYTFTIEYDGKPMRVSLPINVENVKKHLNCGHTRAYRVACELLSDWVIRTVRMIKAGQIHIAEAFLPYIFDEHKGQTFFQTIVEWHTKREGRQ